MKKIVFSLVLCIAVCSIGLASQDQAPAAKKKKNEVTIKGCVGRMSGDYLLFQTNPGNSYLLESNRKIRLRNYLGQQVEVTGREEPTLSTSMNFSVRRAGSPVTILVSSINTLSQECSNE
jgi:hypothetical protein